MIFWIFKIFIFISFIIFLGTLLQSPMKSIEIDYEEDVQEAELKKERLKVLTIKANNILKITTKEKKYGYYNHQDTLQINNAHPSMMIMLKNKNSKKNKQKASRSRFKPKFSTSNSPKNRKSLKPVELGFEEAHQLKRKNLSITSLISLRVFKKEKNSGKSKKGESLIKNGKVF